MPKQGGQESTNQPQSEEVSPLGPSQVNDAASRPPRRLSRADLRRLLLWVVVGLLIPGLLAVAVRHAFGHGTATISLRDQLPSRAITSFFMFLATWMVSRLEKRSLADYGIPPRQAFGMRFWEGGAWGFAVFSLVLLVLWASGHFQVDSVALTGNAIYCYGFGWAAVFLGVALSEELAYRGYWFWFTCRYLGFWRSGVFLSLVFAAAHLGNHGENPLGLLQVFAMGLLFCLAVRRTGNLWFAIGFHAAWDWAESFFYGTPDSGLLSEGRLFNSSASGPGWLTGDSAGPEGSVVALVALLFCALLIHLRFPKVTYPDNPA